MTDAGVIIVGAGPTGLMLSGELRLAGVRPLVLERQPQIRAIPKAGGLSGQILEEVVGLSQDDATVTADVRGSDAPQAGPQAVGATDSRNERGRGG